ncbi:hypothetical protein KY309_02070 [Candidatus Woesearchaeota archaeon]|nr:hypothetical protein [Candidatus Woesearchaeota archaeon]MBW3016374.1 hypothetical protein [Candidatus Woesearchaeota archaeon]
MVKEAFQLLVNIGLIDVILPFLLVFTITYAVLQKTQVFGKESKKVNAMTAFVMGFFAVMTANLLNIINIIIFYFVLLLIIGLLLALIIGMTGGEVKSKLYISIMLVLAGIFIFYGMVQAGIIEQNRFWTAFVIPLLLLIVIVWLIVKHYKKKPAQRAPQQAPRPEPVTPP